MIASLELFDVATGLTVMMFFMIHPATTIMVFRLLSCEDSGTVIV